MPPQAICGPVVAQLLVPVATSWGADTTTTRQRATARQENARAPACGGGRYVSTDRVQEFGTGTTAFWELGAVLRGVVCDGRFSWKFCWPWQNPSTNEHGDPSVEKD